MNLGWKFILMEGCLSIQIDRKKYFGSEKKKNPHKTNKQTQIQTKNQMNHKTSFRKALDHFNIII